MILDKKYKIQYTAMLKTSDPGIKLWIAQPINRDYQKITNFSVSLPVHSKYQDFHKNTINYLDFPKNNEIKLEISFEVQNKFFKENINPETIKIPSKKSLIYKTYTKNTKFLEQTIGMKKIAKELKRNEQNSLDIAKKIFLYTMEKFQYQYPVKKRGIKNLQLNKLKGDCGEYSAFFTTLCRINNIPSRINTGFVVFPENETIKEHAWNSIYLKPYGWLDVDTQYGSLEKTHKIALKEYFCKRIENRIVFTTDYNIPIKPQAPQNYKLTYWKKQYLPIDKKYTQILQPLIFATKHKISFFKEEFKLIL